MLSRLIITFFLVLIASFSAFSQCAMCKAVVESDAGMAKGINDGILYLMSIPYILLVVIGYFVYKHYKKTSTDV
jgi:xanthine/uracil/vitamin C permease (AzgA family)